jgi:SpoVK/Ycf46/Vps4 family AAA+-type ATPase
MIPRFLLSDSALSRTRQTEPIVQLWTLRFLVKLELHRCLIKPGGWASDLVAHALSLPDMRLPGANRSRLLRDEEDNDSLRDEAEGSFDTHAALDLLHERLVSAEADAAQVQPPHIVAANIEQLRLLVGLSDVEARILMFAAMVHTDLVLDKMSDWVGDLTSARLYHALSAVLDIEEKAVRSALSLQGTLARSGLLTVDRKERWTLASKLDLLSGGFADCIVSDSVETLDFLRGMVTLAAPPTLIVQDFAHIEEQVGLVRTYLERVSTTRRRGVNILVHGAPGTGKTELTRVLAGALQMKLYEVTGENTDGDAVPGEQRLRAFRAAQAFFSERQAWIVFDEAEDVFSDGGPGERSVAQARKAWLNRALEENPVPTFWLSNSVDGVDAAFVRRFDMVLHMPVPPARARSRIILNACARLMPETIADRLAANATLTPGVVARAAAVLQHSSDDWTPQRFGDALEWLVSGTLEAQGHAPLAPRGTAAGPRFDPRFVNVNIDLASLAQGIEKTRSARLCLYGPPGTGKTAFGTWLAEELDCPLMLRRASDLISPYVGETEQNIARIFREATRERALLLIDEADSFLRDRAGSRHSWEVTAVNEMLTQMEYFEGVLVMSTNLFELLDEAALRRFDAKLCFRYLTRQQVQMFFLERCKAMELDDSATACERLLSNVETLAPGDFATVIRRHRLSPVRSAIDFANALAEECRARQRGAMPIGFL